MEVFILWIGINALIGYAIGKPKNAIGPCMLLSILLGPIGWLVALISGSNTRTCPFCSEDIKPDAKVCRYCSRDLPPVVTPPIVNLRAKYDYPTERPSPKIFGIILAAIVVAAAIIGSVIIFTHNSTVKAKRQDEEFDRLTASTPVTSRPRQSVTIYHEPETPTPPAGPSVTIYHEPETPTPPPESVTLTRPTSLTVRYGTIQLKPGTRLHVVSLEGANVRVHYLDADHLIPASATDLK